MPPCVSRPGLLRYTSGCCLLHLFVDPPKHGVDSKRLESRVQRCPLNRTLISVVRALHCDETVVEKHKCFAYNGAQTTLRKPADK